VTSAWDLPLPDFDTATYQWAAENAEGMADAVKATINVKTGRTQASIQAEGVGDSIAVTGDPVAGYLQTGTEAHEIHGKPWLAFEGRDGMVFLNNDRGQFVHHPGTGPYPYVEDAIDAQQEALGGALLDTLTAGWAS
jgi:hypothetical protein